MQHFSPNDSDKFISKKMSYALRHNPGKYGLKLDEYGYTDLHEFLTAMNRVHHFKPRLTEARISQVMGRANKERFKIKTAVFVRCMVISFLGLSSIPLLYHRKFSIMEQLVVS